MVHEKRKSGHCPTERVRAGKGEGNFDYLFSTLVHVPWLHACCFKSINTPPAAHFLLHHNHRFNSFSSSSIIQTTAFVLPLLLLFCSLFSSLLKQKRNAIISLILFPITHYQQTKKTVQQWSTT